jgi:NAD-reducing hydrogenase large subunit
MPPAIEAAERTLAWWNERLPGWADDSAPCAGLDTSFLAHVGAGGELEYAKGGLRVLSPRGEILEDALTPADCLQRIVERPVPWSYAKLCAWRGVRGQPCTYQVGPLARLNAAATCGTPRADRALSEWRRHGGGIVRAPLHFHGARLVEILSALERIAELLTSAEILSRDVLASEGVLRREAVGACEAPRGVLFHRYRVDQHGIVTSVDIVAPTGQNARAMNAAVRHVARQTVRGDRLTAAVRNRVAAALRAFDPCLSCATHTFDGPGILLLLVDAGGEVLDEWPPVGTRDANHS